jgi:hypothetical protein
MKDYKFMDPSEFPHLFPGEKKKLTRPYPWEMAWRDMGARRYSRLENERIQRANQRREAAIPEMLTLQGLNGLLDQSESEMYQRDKKRLEDQYIDTRLKLLSARSRNRRNTNPSRPVILPPQRDVLGSAIQDAGVPLTISEYKFNANTPSFQPRNSGFGSVLPQQTCGFGKKKCKSGKKLGPTNKKLYNSIKSRVKRRIKSSGGVWPGRYASYEVVHKYRKAGGGYRCQFGSVLPQQTCGFGLNPPNEWQAVGNAVEFHAHNIMNAIGLKDGDLVHIKGTPPNKRYIINEIRVYGPRCETMIWCIDSEAPPGNREDKYIKYVSITEITDSVCDPDSINYEPRPRAGVRVQGFGKSLESFYREGSSNNINLTPGIRKCETIVYEPQISKSRTMFGKTNVLNLEINYLKKL